MTMRKGRKSLRKTVGGLSPPASSSSPAMNKNWMAIPSLKTLPKEQGEVKLVETFVETLKDPRTNPNGAVSVVNYGGQTYCLSSSCSSCKIPLTKAKILEANEETGGKDPRIACDFCGSTYNIRTGEPVADAEANRGLVGGVMKGIFSKNEKTSLATYDLGERNGAVMISFKE
eukprot:CAMPEP_0172500278 /NCGR_PEP_ID=MMETSP1066-20121228/136367_1 /TAXON_ID=671091 /ORGANISM="Coscinodiscus wailesii, Strain CCMP2513" /LENGTH=172 /DNA_ID=CAMNT_0013274421 /DNA_START=303 /DNA_END=821 /DNA_ORIENTATION=+